MEDLEEKNGNVYEEIASGVYSGKGRIKSLHIFSPGNKSNTFLFLFKTNRTSYRSFFSLNKLSDQLRLALASRSFPKERVREIMISFFFVSALYNHYGAGFWLCSTKSNKFPF